MSISLGDRFNSAVGIEMIDDISKTEHKFDSIASVGKFGMYQYSQTLIIIWTLRRP